MTWYELIWFLMLPALFVLGIVISIIDYSYNASNDFASLPLLFCIMWCVVGGLCLVLTLNRDYKQTAQVETIPIVTKLSDNGLDIILDDYQHFHWVDYGLISKWKNGGKFYKTYYFDKHQFGPDNDKFELIIK